MEIEVATQLRLLESEPFPGGPARPPTVRRSRKPAGGTTLSLFGPPPSPEPPPVVPAPVPVVAAPVVEEERDARLLAIDRVIAETVARHKAAREPAADQSDPMRDPIPPDEVQLPVAGEAPFDVRQFQFVATPKPADRAALVSLLAERLAGFVLRGGRFRAEADEERIDGRVEGKALSVSFSGAAARSRWLGVVQEVARERGLAELE